MKTLTLVLSLLLLAPSTAIAQPTGDAVRIMRDVAAQCPRAFSFAHADHNTHPERLDFIILAAQALKRFDPLFGMNGKRGNASDPSADAIAYGVGTNVRVADILVGAGEHMNRREPLDAIVWNDVTGVGGAGAVYVDPDGHRPRVACGASPQPPPATGPGAFTAQHAEIFARLGTPNGSLDAGFVRRVAEQFAHSFPGESWGMKSADASRPLSGDVLARMLDGQLVGYRIVPKPSSVVQIALPGQHFVAAAAVNHLGDAPAPVPPPTPVPTPTPVPVPVPPPVNVQPVLDALAALSAQLTALQESIAAIGAQPLPAIDWPSFKSRLLGQNFVLTPCGGSTGRAC